MCKDPQYQCPICGLKVVAIGLFTHIEVFHEVRRRFCQCPFCGEDYMASNWSVNPKITCNQIRNSADSHIRSCNTYAASLLAGVMVRSDPRR